MKLYSKNTQCPFSSFPMISEGGGAKHRRKEVCSVPARMRSTNEEIEETCVREHLLTRTCLRVALRKSGVAPEETQQHAENRCTTKEERSGRHSSVNISPQQMHLKTRPATHGTGIFFLQLKRLFASHCLSKDNNALKCTVSRI